MPNEHTDLRISIRAAVKSIISEIPEERMDEQLQEQAEEIEDRIMKKISENFRSLSEIKKIVELVRAGENVEIDYYDPEEDDMDPEGVVYKTCW